LAICVSQTALWDPGGSNTLRPHYGTHSGCRAPTDYWDQRGPAALPYSLIMRAILSHERREERREVQLVHDWLVADQPWPLSPETARHGQSLLSETECLTLPGSRPGTQPAGTTRPCGAGEALPGDSQSRTFAQSMLAAVHRTTFYAEADRSHSSSLRLHLEHLGFASSGSHASLTAL